MQTKRVFLSDKGLRSLEPGWRINVQSDPASGRFHNYIGTFVELVEEKGEITALLIDDGGVEIRFPRALLRFLMRIS